mgnify:CR=1 FL=1
MSACPHLLTLVCPIPALQEDMPHRLRPIAALAFVGISFVDSVKVRPQADLACAHLCDRGADCPMCSNVCVENSFSRTNPEFKKVSTVLRALPGRLLFAFHRLMDGRFRGRYQCPYRVWIRLFGI